MLREVLTLTGALFLASIGVACLMWLASRREESLWDLSDEDDLG